MLALVLIFPVTHDVVDHLSLEETDEGDCPLQLLGVELVLAVLLIVFDESYARDLHLMYQLIIRKRTVKEFAKQIMFTYIFRVLPELLGLGRLRGQDHHDIASSLHLDDALQQ